MSEQEQVAPRIGKAANLGVTATLFSIAIITYAIRTYIRIRVMKRFLADDYLLLFAVIVLIAVTGIAFAAIGHQYDILAVLLHGAESDLLFNVLGEITITSIEENTASTLWWFVIVPVKLAFAVFFRRIVNRVRSLRILCDCVIGFTVLSGLICIAVSWLTCPYFTLQGMISCSTPDATYRVLRDTGITTALDIVSDGLLVSVPIIILQRTHIKMQQKLTVAVPLCLSLIMAMVAVTRMSAIRLQGGSVDIVWLAFWQQQECSIAVIMISISAFRSFFVKSASSKRGSPGNNEPSPRKYIFSKGSANVIDLPEIPSATLTGMMTVIEAAGSPTESEYSGIDLKRLEEEP